MPIKGQAGQKDTQMKARSLRVPEEEKTPGHAPQGAVPGKHSSKVDLYGQLLHDK